jgi:hypothetical protein
MDYNQESNDPLEFIKQLFSTFIIILIIIGYISTLKPIG